MGNTVNTLDTSSKIAFINSPWGKMANGIYNHEIISDSNNWNWYGDINYYWEARQILYSYELQTHDTLYYPIKFFLNGKYYFGWLYFESSFNYVILFQTAICLIPNQAIYSGHYGIYHYADTTKIDTSFNTTYSTLKIYSNPSMNGEYTIEIPLDMAARDGILLSVYDAKGSLILNQELNNHPNKTIIYLDGKSKGIYLVQISDVGNRYFRYSGKVIKE